MKTDKVDARILAQLLAADFLPPVWLPDVRTKDEDCAFARRRSCSSPPRLGYDYNDKQLRHQERKLVEQAEAAYATLVAQWQPKRPSPRRA